MDRRKQAASINLGILKGVFPTSASLLADELDCLVICDLNGLAVREPAQVGLRPDDGRTGLTRQRDGPSWGKDVLPLGSEPTGAGNTRKRAQGQGHAPELALGTISFNSGSKSGGWFLRAVMVDSDRRRGLPRLLELARNNLCTSTGSGGSGSASGSGEHRHPACLYPLYPALHLAPMAQRGQLTLSIDATWRRRTHRTRCTRPYSAEMRDLGPSRHGSRKPWWPPPQRDHRHRRSRTCGARSARWVCRVDGSAITGGALPPALASPWVGRSGLGRHRSGRSVAHGVPGVPSSHASTGQLLFQHTTKGIKKVIATGVKKPDTCVSVAKAEKLPPPEMGVATE